MSNVERLDMSHHSLNKSSSKQNFSFSKANRFLPPVKPTCDQSYYNLPSTKERRSASFGVGNKAEMALDKRDVPPPNRYKIDGEFQHLTLTKKRGFSFGYGREQVVGGPLSDTRRARQIPGPGQYPNYSTLQSRSATIKSRLPDRSLSQLQKIPGPGAYNTPSAISPQGHYILSNFKNCVSKSILPEGSRRNLRVKSPGPGQYDSKGTTIDPQGKYYLARFHNSNVRTFSKSQRPSMASKESGKIPGPGAYGIFSEFS